MFKMHSLIYVSLIVILILLLIFLFSNSEKFVNPTIQATPFVRLYERFNQKNLIFDLTPVLQDPTSMYFRDIVKAEIKSMDLNLPLKHDNLDDARKIEIWSVYPGDTTSSSESDFYNPFTEPDYARRANSAKYKLLVDMKAGNRIKLNLDEPVKKVFIYARL